MLPTPRSIYSAYSKPPGLRVRALLPAQVLAVPAVPPPVERSSRSKPPTAPPLPMAVLPLIVFPDVLDSARIPSPSLFINILPAIVLPTTLKRRIPSAWLFFTIWAETVAIWPEMTIPARKQFEIVLPFTRLEFPVIKIPPFDRLTVFAVSVQLLH